MRILLTEKALDWSIKETYSGIFTALALSVNKNQNGLIYNPDNMEDAIIRYNNKVEKNLALGELILLKECDFGLGYGLNAQLSYNLDIQLSKVSHVIKNLTFNKNKGAVYAEFVILNTPSGELVRDFLKYCKFRCRAIGVVNKNNVIIDEIIAFDICII